MSGKPNFYIVTPPYKHSSAGICALHYLAETMNKLGYPTYLVFQLTVNQEEPAVYFMSADKSLYSPDRVHTPLVSGELNIKAHRDTFRSSVFGAIVIYSDTTLGNPLNATRVARYYLNRDGMLGVWNGKNKGEFRIGQSQMLTPDAHDYLHYVESLSPLVDWVDRMDVESFSRPLNLTYIGKGSIYSPKAKRLEGTLEISRDWPNTRMQLWTLFTHTANFYSWDALSATNAEALILGAKVYYQQFHPFTLEELEQYETSPLCSREELIARVEYYRNMWEDMVDLMVVKMMAFDEYNLTGAF